MLAETITEWTENWMLEGKIKGLAEGEVKGEIKGIGKGRMIERIILLQQILKRPTYSEDELIAKEMSELKTLSESIEKEWQAVQN